MVTWCFAMGVLAASLLGGGQAQDMPTYNFLTRPDIRAPEFEITSIDPGRVSEGYIFTTPNTPNSGNFTMAPFIYNNQGGLVWSGHSLAYPDYAITNFRVCTYQSAPHLCVIMYIGPRGGGESFRSFALILDHDYRPIQTLAPGTQYNGKRLTQDLHEFNPVEPTGETALLNSYATVEHPTKLPQCGGRTPRYILTSIFTEVSTDGLNTTLFEWNSLDHINVTDTYACPGWFLVGDGSREDAFDYFHTNSIDKNEDGDYLISSRHTSSILKIAGLHSPSGEAPGTILWQLGGEGNTFKQLRTEVPGSGDFNFSFQHDARFRPGGISLWNNANNGIVNPSAVASSAMEVAIDAVAKTATLVWQAIAPSHALDDSQGNHQVLPNGNHFCALGSTPEVFETTPDGAVVFDARLGLMPMRSYRVFKYAWEGRPPVSELAVLAYARHCGAPLAFYVSWNGATEVAQYRFFAGNAPDGPFVDAGAVQKGGEFETLHVSQVFGRFAYVEARDADGKLLGATPHVATFVPEAGLAECDAVRCSFEINYAVAPRMNCPG